MYVWCRRAYKDSDCTLIVANNLPLLMQLIAFFMFIMRMISCDGSNGCKDDKLSMYVFPACTGATAPPFAAEAKLLWLENCRQMFWHRRRSNFRGYSVWRYLVSKSQCSKRSNSNQQPNTCCNWVGADAIFQVRWRIPLGPAADDAFMVIRHCLMSPIDRLWQYFLES